MLETLEKVLVRTLAPAMVGTRIVSGPAGSSADPRIQILASRLSLPTLTEEGEQGTPRLGALLSVPESDPKRQNWPIPGSKGLQVTEVSTAAGEPLRRGDHFLVDQDPTGDFRIRLYRPLAMGEGLQVFLEGESTRGQSLRLPGTLDLSVIAYANEAAQADLLLGRALAPLLPLLAALPTLEAAWNRLSPVLPVASGVRLKMLAPSTRLTGMDRLWDRDSNSARAEAHFQISGQVGLTVAIGTAEPMTVIAAVRGELRSGIRTQSYGVGMASTVDLAPPPPPPAPVRIRPAESLDVVRLKAVGDATATRLKALGASTLLALRELSDAQINTESSLSSVRSQVKSGKLQAIAVLADELDARLPAPLLERTVGSLTALSADALRMQALADSLPNTPEGQAAVLHLQRYLLVLVDSLDTAWLSTTKLGAFAVK